jgi:hypothetical protein
MKLKLLICVVLALLGLQAQSYAQATRTWVSGVGDDVNPCSRTAPCKTFAGAMSKTAAGGEINCIDPGGFGALTITKALTIDCSNTEASVLVAGTSGITISAAATDVVTLRGIEIVGTQVTPAINGINFLTGAALHVEKCVIRQFLAQGPFPAGFGIQFGPSGASELYVTDTVLTNNGAGSTGGALNVRPTGSGSAKATLNNVYANNNITGVTADNGTTSGSVFITVHNSISSGNTLAGFSAVAGTGSGSAIITLDRSASVNNGTGLSASGANAEMSVGGSSIIGNATTGLSSSVGSLGIHSYGTNQLSNNTVDGAFTPPLIGPK